MSIDRMSDGRPASGKQRPVRRSAPKRGGRKASSENHLLKAAIEWGKSLAIAVVIFLVLRTFLIQTFVITSGSMRDTLLVGDFLMVSRLAYGAQIPGTDLRTPGYEEVARGDIVVFRPPHEPDLDVVKRVIGIEGDTLAMRDKVLSRNGAPLSESYARYTRFDQDLRAPAMSWQLPHILPESRPEDFRPSRDEWGPVVVPPGHLFVMGDNRDNSIDSRYWGFLGEGAVKGQALFIYWSYDRDSFTPFPWIREVRWNRIGDLIR